jgi:hypothetical protein
MPVPSTRIYKKCKTHKMKTQMTFRMVCTLIAAMFLFGACTVGYRARHGHYDDQRHYDNQHQRDMNHGDHN